MKKIFDEETTVKESENDYYDYESIDDTKNIQISRGMPQDDSTENSHYYDDGLDFHSPSNSHDGLDFPRHLGSPRSYHSDLGYSEEETEEDQGYLAPEGSTLRFTVPTRELAQQGVRTRVDFVPGVVPGVVPGEEDEFEEEVQEGIASLQLTEEGLGLADIDMGNGSVTVTQSDLSSAWESGLEKLAEVRAGLTDFFSPQRKNDDPFATHNKINKTP